MQWNKELINYWCENYYALRDYEINPFEEIFFVSNFITSRDIINKDIGISGIRRDSAPYEDTCDMNWEFDRALKKLGSGEFKRLYIDGEGEDIELFNEFAKILMEVSSG